MILSPQDLIRKTVAEGGWSRLTVDQVFRRGLEADPGAVVLRDLAPAAVPGTGAALTAADADRRIEGLAAFLAAVGLKPDAVIGIHLPPSADAAVIVMAALRAGLIVCPLPLHYGPAEMAAAIDAAGIRAIVTGSEIEGEPSGERVRDVAAESFAIRFVFAVGAGVPDGLIDLAEVLAELDALGPAPVVARRGAPADHVAMLSLARDAADRLVVVPFSHNHLVAAALAHVLEAGIAGPETVLGTMHPAAPGGFVAGTLTALLSGGQAAFHHATRLDRLAEAAVECGADRVVAPAALGPLLAQALPEPVALSLVSTGLAADRAAVPASRRTTDLLTLGGICLLPLGRGDGLAAGLPSGPVRLPRGSADGPVLFETRWKGPARTAGPGSGELMLAGAIVPDAPWPEPPSGGSGAGLSFAADGSLRTGIVTVPAADGAEIRIAPDDGDRLSIAGQPISAARLDALARRHPAAADAAVFPVEAPLVGWRVGVAVVPVPGGRLDLETMEALLAEAGPLAAPVMVVPVAEIPRAQDGTVRRDRLFARAVA